MLVLVFDGLFLVALDASFVQGVEDGANNS